MPYCVTDGNKYLLNTNTLCACFIMLRSIDDVQFSCSRFCKLVFMCVPNAVGLGIERRTNKGMKTEYGVRRTESTLQCTVFV